MVRRLLALSLLALLATAVAHGQAVQLPSITTFGSDTTVLVPDRGAASLGGNATGRAGSTVVGGLPPQRGIGIDRSASGLSVTARVHDMHELDRQLLETAPPRNVAPQPLSVRPAGDAALPSVADIRRRLAARARPAQDEIDSLLARARAAHSAGKDTVARTYYHMAARRATGSRQAQIVAEGRTLSHPAAKAKDSHGSQRLGSR
jgi:hypothetical protein